MGALLGNLGGGGSFARGPKGYERKGLWMGSPYGGSFGQPGVDSSTGDFGIL